MLSSNSKNITINRIVFSVTIVDVMKLLQMIRYATYQLDLTSEIFNSNAILHISNCEYLFGAISQRNQYRHPEVF